MNLCKCGCGILVKNNYKKGHGSRNRSLPEVVKQRISNSLIGHIGLKGENNPMYGKRGILSPLYGKVGKSLGKITSEEIKKKLSIAGRGRIFSILTRGRISKALKGKPKLLHGKSHPNYGKPLKKNRCIWFNVNNIKCQGTFEKRFVETCLKYNISVTRNIKRFHLKDERGEFTYLPDFNSNGQLIEIKGWVGPNSKRKLQAIKDNDLPVRVIYEKELIEFEKNGILGEKYE